MSDFAKNLIAATGCPRCQDLIREWRRAAKEEVDFQLEAKNALQASKALRRNSVDVVCPEPLQDLCSQRVLTMVFIEGWKITDLDRMPYGADREGLARNLVHAFALLVFEEGPYSRRSPSRQCLCTTSSWWKKCERGSACLA